MDRGKVEAAGCLGCSGRIPRKVEIGWRREEGNRVRLGFDWFIYILAGGWLRG